VILENLFRNYISDSKSYGSHFGMNVHIVTGMNAHTDIGINARINSDKNVQINIGKNAHYRWTACTAISIVAWISV